MRSARWVYSALVGLMVFNDRGAAQEAWWFLGGADGVPWAEVGAYSKMIDDSTVSGALQPFELKPDENLLPRLHPWHPWRFPVDPDYRPEHPRLWTDINHNTIYRSTATALFVDGDPGTYVERRGTLMLDKGWQPGGIFYTIDLGTQVPIDRFVFYPPDGVSPESDEPFTPNYVLKSFSLSANVEETGIMQDELERGFVWRGEGPCCALDVPLAHEERNSAAITDIGFTLQNLRFLRLIAIPDGFTLYGDPIVTRLAFAEMEVYGRGFAPMATWESQIIDLGREVNFGKVVFAVSKWRKDGEQIVAADGPVRAQVEIRTGRDDTPTRYFGYDDLGAYVEVTRRQWNRLTPPETRGSTIAVGYRGPTAEDLENWSFWSLPLSESGQHPRLPWGQYMQIRVQLATDAFFDFARLDSLRIAIAPLLADRIVGEVALAGEFQPQGGRVQVPAGETRPFVLDIGVEFSSADRNGFDALRISAPARAEFSWVELGDPLERVEPDSVLHEDQGFVIYLPRRLGPAGDRRLRIGLQSALYGEAGEFGGEVFDRGESNQVQRIEGGDVGEELGSDQLLVLASESSAQVVLGEVEVGSGAFTPQGDGVNDLLSIHYTLFRLREGSQVRVGVYALDGRRVWSAPMGLQYAGRHEIRWDGRDDTGRTVVPGLYLARVEADSDKGSEVRMSPVSIVY